MTTQALQEKTHTQRVATRAGAIGNFIEFYDFSLYGFFAVFFAAQFFPSLNPTAGLLAAFGIYGGAFVMRPVGAVVFGHIADRLGRKKALVLAVILMSVATAGIGLLPTYATVGLVAPALLLLLRLTQAFSAGGEQSGAYVMVLEHAPINVRGRAGGALVVAVMGGVVSGIGLSLLVESAVSAEAMAAWGWRVPFLIALPLGLFGLYLRLKLEESEMFTSAATAVRTAEARGLVKHRTPLNQAFRTQKKNMLVLFGWIASLSLVGYLLIGFMVTLLVKFEGYSQQQALSMMAIAFVIAMPLVWLICGWADKISRKKFAAILAATFIILPVPAFLLLGLGPVTATLALTLWVIAMYPMNLAAGFLVVELFPTDIRASASAVPYQLGFAVFGGTAPFVATWLSSSFSTTAVGFYATAMAVVGLAVAIWGVPNARKMDEISIKVDIATEPVVTAKSAGNRG
jgi:MHS family proline/betaine transporter-like MFS transporter